MKTRIFFRNDASKLFAAQKLLQISGCAQYEMQNYNGQLFTFEDLRKIDGFPQFESDKKMVKFVTFTKTTIFFYSFKISF